MYTCDICGESMSYSAKRVSSDQMRIAVRAGYRPPGSSSQRMHALGVPTDVFHAQWLQQVMGNTADWELCTTCAARFDQYAGQVGASNESDIGSHYYQCPHCKHVFRKDDQMYELAQVARSAIIGSRGCPSCGDPLSLTDVFDGKYDVPVSDVLSGKYGTHLLDGLRVLASEGKIVLTPEEHEILGNGELGLCDITGKEGLIVKLPFPIYKIEQPEDDADKLQKLEAAKPEILKVGKDIMKECRSYLAKIGLQYYWYCLLGLIVIFGMLLIANHLPVVVCGAASIVFLVIAAFFIKSVRYFSVLKLSTPSDYVFKSYYIDTVFKNNLNIDPEKVIFEHLSHYLTKRSGQYVYFSGLQREAQMTKLKRQMKSLHHLPAGSNRESTDAQTDKTKAHESSGSAET